MRTEVSKVRDWLKALASLTAEKQSAEDLAARVDAMAPLLVREFDRGTFSPASLAHVAKASKWFPSYAEACEALTAFRKTQAPVYPALAAPAPQRSPTSEDDADRADRAWWDERIRGVEDMENPTARWREASGMYAVLTRPSAHVREWAIGRLVVVMDQARAAGADTDPSGVRYVRATAPSLRYIAGPQGRRSAAPPEPDGPPPRTAHLTAEQIAHLGHRERRY